MLKKSLKFRSVMIMLFFTSVFCLNAQALQAFKYKWIKVKTEHFTVLASKEHKDYALLAAKKAEAAFETLKALSPQHPKNTILVLDHTKDASNGSATFFPYPQIVIQPFVPSPKSSIGQYEDWLYELLLHEYTHILSFHNVRGLYRPLRFLLGSTVSPAYFLPTWYLEGLAVFTESHMTNGGRLRSTRFHAYKKHLTASNIAFANEQDTAHFPFGASPYAFGSWLVHNSTTQAQSITPVKASAKVHKTFSGRFPFFISSGFHKATKVGAYKSWRQVFSDNKKTLPADSLLGRNPQYSSFHKDFFYVVRDFNGNHSMMQFQNGKKKKLFQTPRLLNYQVLEDQIFFLSQDIEEQDHLVQNLSSYNFKTKKIKKLTTNLHASDFSILKDKVLYVKNTLKKNELILTSLKDLKKQNLLFQSSIEERISLPRFQNDSKAFFAFKSPHSKEKLYAIDINTKEVSTLHEQEHITFISRSKPHSFLFEEGGLKYLSQIGSPKRTQVEIEVDSLDFINEKSFYYAFVTSEDLHIQKGKIEDLASKLPNPDPILKVKMPDFNLSYEPKVSRYSSLYKLKPNYLIPNFTLSPYGFSEAVLYGVSTGSKDPLGFNNYSLNFFTDSITDQPSLSFRYTSQHYRMPIEIFTGVTYDPLTLDLARKTTTYSLGSSFNHKFNFGRSFNMSFQGFWDETEFEGSDFSIQRAGLNYTLSYNRSELLRRETAPQKGYQARLSSTYFLPTGQENEIDYTRISYGVRKYFSSPLAKSHRLVFGIDGQWNSESLPGLFSVSSRNQVYRGSGMGGFLVRGLPTGSLLSNEWFALSHLEYRFDILNVDWGPGLLPAFLYNVTGAFTADYGVMRGREGLTSTDPNSPFTNITENTALYSAGAEIIINGKAFYHLPASFQIGAYKFLNNDLYDGGLEVFVGFGVTGLP